MTGSDAAAAAAYIALYERIQPSLLRYAERLTGEADVAEDVVQEAFLRLLSRPELRGEDARLWLFTVVINLVRDRGRTATRRQRLLTAIPVHQSAPPLPDEMLLRAERVESVRAALGQLSERDRQILLMREEGFRYEEIASAIEVSASSVGTLVARALKRFVEVYKPDAKHDDAP